jgi:multidrug efflux pump subunit AcrA (membrane-fusion protein)
VAAAEADIRRAIEQMGGDDVDQYTVLQTALTEVDKAELDLANTVVTAPAAGVITDLRTDVGLYAGTGSPVLTLVAIRDVWINAEFTENNLGHMQVGTPVDIVFDALHRTRVQRPPCAASAGRQCRQRAAAGHVAVDSTTVATGCGSRSASRDRGIRCATGSRAA